MKLGTFQAVQQMVAVMAIELEGARHVTRQALWRLGDGRPADREVAIAKAWTGTRLPRHHARSRTSCTAGRATSSSTSCIATRCAPSRPSCCSGRRRSGSRTWPTQLRLDCPRRVAAAPAAGPGRDVVGDDHSWSRRLRFWPPCTPASRAVTVAAGSTASGRRDRLQQPPPRSPPTAGCSCSRRLARFASGPRPAGLAAAPLITLPSCTDSEMGLLGLAFDPEFARNGFLYLYHTQPPGGDAARCAEGAAAGRQNRVVRVTVSGDRMPIRPAWSCCSAACGPTTAITTAAASASGPTASSTSAWATPAVGDGGRPGASTNPYARDLERARGQDPAPGARRQPGAGQSLSSDAAARPTSSSRSGLRNPFRFAFDPRTGLLWAGDVGQNTVRGDRRRARRRRPRLAALRGLGPGGRRAPGDTVPPVYVYRTRRDGASVTGGVFYDGSQFDVGLRGDYFFGDFVFDLVWRARLDAARTGVRRRRRRSSCATRPARWISRSGRTARSTTSPSPRAGRARDAGHRGRRPTAAGARWRAAPAAPAACGTPAGGLRRRLSGAAGVPVRCARRLRRACGAPPGAVRRARMRAVRDGGRPRRLPGRCGRGDRHRGGPRGGAQGDDRCTRRVRRVGAA